METAPVVAAEPARPVPGPRSGRGVVVLVGAACALVGVALDRRGLAAWPDIRTDLDGLRILAVLLVGVGALGTLATSRSGRTFWAVVATTGVVPLGIATSEALRTGLPGPSTPVLAVGLAVAYLGALARTLLADGPPVGARRRVVVAVVTAAVAATAAVPAAAVVGDLAVVSSTAAPVAIAPVPQRPTGVLWSIGARGVVDVRAAGAGVAVATDRGIAGLDGRTGEQRWSFDRTGARVSALAVSPDGASLAVVHSARRAEAPVLTVLDALTGAPRWDVPVRDAAPTLLLTDAVLVVPEPLPDDGEDPRHRLVARSLVTGDVLWRAESPAGCRLDPEPLTLRGTVPLAGWCGGAYVVRGLAETDGVERWATTVGRVSPEGYATGPGLPPATSPDGDVLVVSTESGYATLDPATGRILARTTGRLEPLDPGPVQRRDEAGLAAFDPVTGVSTPVGPGCPDEWRAGLVGDTVVRICRADGYRAQVGGGPLLDAVLGTGYRDDEIVPLDLRRRRLVVVAPGAVVLAVAERRGTIVGLG